MAALTLQQIRDQVRTTVELDSTDIPDSILDLFIQEGYDHIVHAEHRWIFYEDNFTFDTVTGQRSYTFASIDPTLEVLDGVEHSSWMLLPIAHQLAQGQYAGSSVSGTPTNFSVWADSIYLWPTPSEVRTVTVRGYRKPSDWIAGGAGATPDLPDAFHPLLVLWALHRAYLQQDDAQMGQMLRQMFNEQFRNLRNDYTQALFPEPSIMGATHGTVFSMIPPRLRYPFDY